MLPSYIDLYNRVDLYQAAPRKSDLFIKHCQKYDTNNGKVFVKQGQFFLYEEIKHTIGDQYEISYPKIGIFLHMMVADQALEFEWVNYRRTWEYHREYMYEHEGREITNYYADIPSQIQSIICWYDEILIYGAWDKLPNWKELKTYYQNTWWYYKPLDVLRHQKIDNLLFKYETEKTQD